MPRFPDFYDTEDEREGEEYKRVREATELRADVLWQESDADCAVAECERAFRGDQAPSMAHVDALHVACTRRRIFERVTEYFTGMRTPPLRLVSTMQVWGKSCTDYTALNFYGGVWTVGSSSECDYAAPGLAALHACFYTQDGSVFVRGAGGDVFLRGAQVHGHELVRDGDVVGLGPSRSVNITVRLADPTCVHGIVRTRPLQYCARLAGQGQRRRGARVPRKAEGGETGTCVHWTQKMKKDVQRDMKQKKLEKRESRVLSQRKEEKKEEDKEERKEEDKEERKEERKEEEEHGVQVKEKENDGTTAKLLAEAAKKNEVRAAKRRAPGPSGHVDEPASPCKAARIEGAVQAAKGDDVRGNAECTDDSSWTLMFALLRAYKQKHGHCRVTRKAGDKHTCRLGEWVHRQRHAYRDARANSVPRHPPSDARRIELLNSIGFVWFPVRARPQRCARARSPLATCVAQVPQTVPKRHVAQGP
jgi:hypothetical protein